MEGTCCHVSLHSCYVMPAFNQILTQHCAFVWTETNSTPPVSTSSVLPCPSGLSHQLISSFLLAPQDNVRYHHTIKSGKHVLKGDLAPESGGTDEGPS